MEIEDSNSCLNKAEPDEMLFVLLGRDMVAPNVIREWCRLRIACGKNKLHDAQIQEALACAHRMECDRGMIWEEELTREFYMKDARMWRHRAEIAAGIAVVAITMLGFAMVALRDMKEMIGL
jgi:hypothetical protein